MPPQNKKIRIPAAKFGEEFSVEIGGNSFVLHIHDYPMVIEDAQMGTLVGLVMPVLENRIGQPDEDGGRVFVGHAEQDMEDWANNLKLVGLISGIIWGVCLTLGIQWIW